MVEDWNKLREVKIMKYGSIQTTPKELRKIAKEIETEYDIGKSISFPEKNSDGSKNTKPSEIKYLLSIVNRTGDAEDWEFKE